MIAVLVCGGRDYDDRDHIFLTLDGLQDTYGGIDLVIQGGADGADSIAAMWARTRKVPCLTVYADWDKYGKAAGPMRNTQMLEWEPTLVVAFPGGRGTANMVEQAKRKGFNVLEIRP